MGEIDPFYLTVNLDVSITLDSKFNDFGIWGMYRCTTKNIQHIYINSGLSPADQEVVCHHLIAHHVTYNKVDLVLYREDVLRLEKENRYFPMAHDGFIKKIMNGLEIFPRRNKVTSRT